MSNSNNSNLPQPILLNTEDDRFDAMYSDTMNNSLIQNKTKKQEFTPALCNKIFRANDNIIPDFSEVNTDFSTDANIANDNTGYHCVNTRGSKGVSQVCRPETITNIIHKLDNYGNNIDNNSDDTKKYITMEEFSTLIGEMRVDILALVNLVGVLNKSITNNNEELKNIKSDVCKLVDENNLLKGRITKLKEEGDRRYDTMCKTYDTHIEDLQRSMGTIQKTSKFIDSSSMISLDDNRSTGNIRVVKRDRSNKEIDNVSNTNVKLLKRDQSDMINDNESESSEKGHSSSASTSSMYIDALMEKRAVKQSKTAPPRNKGNTADVYGEPDKKEPEPQYTGNFRQLARQEIVENKSTGQTDSHTARANRLNLNKSNVIDNSSSSKRM